MKYPSKTAAIIAAKRKRQAERALGSAQTPIIAPEPAYDQQAGIARTMLELWAKFEALGGPHLVWRVHRLGEQMRKDSAARADMRVKVDHKGRVTKTEKSFHPWEDWERKLVLSVRAPARTTVQATTFHDIVRLVRSPTGEGTRCDPIYKTISLWFSGGGGIHGKEYTVKSLCKIVEASTPLQVVTWLGNILPRITSGELKRTIELVEARHGAPMSVSPIGQPTEIQADQVRQHAANLLANQVVRESTYARTQKTHHWNPESAVGLVKSGPSRKKVTRERS